MRNTQSDRPSVTNYKGPANNEQVFVLVGGAGVEGKYLFPRIASLLQKRGDVKVITYSTTRFKIEGVIALILNQINSGGTHKKVTFIAASMGGFVAYDTITSMRATGDNRPAKIILIDALGQFNDLVLATPARILSYVPFGPISNWFLTKPIGKLTFKPPALSEVHSEDPNQLEALWDSYRNQPPSGYVDELAYMYHHSPLGKLDNVTGVFIQSTKDEVVKRYAPGSWTVVFGKPLQVLHVNAGHISFLDEPAAYATAINKGLELLG